MLSSGVKNILKSLHLNVFYESKRKLVVIVSVIKLATFLFTHCHAPNTGFLLELLDTVQIVCLTVFTFLAENCIKPILTLPFCFQGYSTW